MATLGSFEDCNSLASEQQRQQRQDSVGESPRHHRIVNAANALSRLASSFVARVNPTGSSSNSSSNTAASSAAPRQDATTTTTDYVSSPRPASKSRTPSPFRRSLQQQQQQPSPSPPPPPPRLEVSPLPPPAFLGAIPRAQTSRGSSVESEDGGSSSSSSALSAESRRCFCGYYSEVPGATVGRSQKPGRCKFCRSRAKYVPGQRSLDAAAGRILGRRHQRLGSGRSRGAGGTMESRRAISEDRRSDGQTPEDTSASNSSAATTASSSFDRASPHSFFSPPFLRRQERLELLSPNLLTVPPRDSFAAAAAAAAASTTTTTTADHGLRTPPTPPSSLVLRPRRPTSEGDHHITHRMAHEMPEYLVPPPRTAILGRAHTDPSSIYDDRGTTTTTSAWGGGGHQHYHPLSPPPAYSEVVREPRQAPPSYEEALHSRLADLRLSSSGQPRTHSEERTSATEGPSSRMAAAASSAAAASAAAAAASRSARSSSRPLMRSSRAEEIPDIYWEQAARELDFCTCRKCQTRYRQYFEEEPDPCGDAMIPMETQVLMQEVLTDGIAFCSLM